MSEGASKTDALSESDYQALGAFRFAMREFMAFSAAGAEEQGLTSQQHQALLAIRVHQGDDAISIGELAEQLLIQNNSAVGLVARLVEGGFVHRAESARDRRRVLVELTPAGAQALDRISMRNLGRLRRSAGVLERLLRTVRRLRLGDGGAQRAGARTERS